MEQIVSFNRTQNSKKNLTNVFQWGRSKWEGGACNSNVHCQRFQYVFAFVWFDHYVNGRFSKWGHLFFWTACELIQLCESVAIVMLSIVIMRNRHDSRTQTKVAVCLLDEEKNLIWPTAGIVVVFCLKSDKRTFVFQTAPSRQSQKAKISLHLSKKAIQQLCCVHSTSDTEARWWPQPNIQPPRLVFFV